MIEEMAKILIKELEDNLQKKQELSKSLKNSDKFTDKTSQEFTTNSDISNQNLSSNLTSKNLPAPNLDQNLQDTSTQIYASDGENLEISTAPNAISFNQTDQSPNQVITVTQIQKDEASLKQEIEFLSAIKERILVLFEGLNSFEITDIEAKLELNVKFLEFLLAAIDERLENLPK
ncbi:MAG: hypothetical protein MR902_02625 [Campylobacter sp.]|nr:hypothetical protein [Campylobacter sp.]